jgi:hypothetical protein
MNNEPIVAAWGENGTVNLNIILGVNIQFIRKVQIIKK